VLSCFVHFWSADMKTSHGEPATICVYSALDESELTIRWQLFACSNACVILATTWTKLEAMFTRRSTGTGVGLGDAVGATVGTGVGWAVGLTVGLTVGEAVGVGVGETVGEGEGIGVGVGVGEVFGENVPL